jgi:RHS repeat-associated protein
VGRVVDPETGLLYLVNRYYDPATGQFLTRDPLVAITGSAYGYAGDNPTNNVDPSGLDFLPGEGGGGLEGPWQRYDGTIVPHNEEVATAYAFFEAHGLTSIQTAGVIGNLTWESEGFNPAKYQDGGGPGRGLAQWTYGSSRWQGLVALAATEGKQWTDLGVQLDFIWQELNTTYASCLSSLEGAKSITDATEIFEQSYEGAGIPHMANRIQDAQDAYDEYGWPG